MSIAEIFIIAIGLAMDAFAVSICLGLASGEKKGIEKYLAPAFYFGFFQAIMPVIGYFSSVNFQSLAADYGRIIAFILLLLIGLNMIREALSKEEECKIENGFGFKTMIILAIATSIDAFATGVSFAFLKTDILLASIIIGIVTFLISIMGVKTGLIFGKKYKKPAEITGGIILISIGLKILFEYLFNIS